MHHMLQGLLAMGIYLFFRVFPLPWASLMGEKAGALCGRFLRHAHIVHRNLELVFPEKSAEEREEIARGMWRHLGRLLAEFMHLPDNALYSRLTLKGMENAPSHLPALYVSAHFGQWELTYPIAYQHGVPVTLVYRHANNPYINRIINTQRATQSSHMFPKGLRGAVQMLRAIKNGNSLALLVDQKMNEGIEVEFFGRKVMAAPAFAQLALRHDMPIVPVRVVRTKGAHFTGNIYPPLNIAKTGDEAADVKRIVQEIYRLFERWIREHPEQYFWLHRRFDKELYR